MQDDIIIIIPMKACPWCSVTGRIKIVDNKCYENWVIRAGCFNNECSMKPVTKQIAIRKTQRQKPYWIEKKIRLAADMWNIGDLPNNGEGFELNITKLIKKWSISEEVIMPPCHGGVPGSIPG